MIKETLQAIVKSQNREETGINRSILSRIDLDSNHAIIISGIRRCGKSTLLRQLMKKIKKFYYFNFEDPRATGFQVKDFFTLEEVFKEEIGESDFYCFDEIQNVPEWEKFVRYLLDCKKKVIITGSNASLLSKELGTKLTGRHLDYELFPFSYKEYLLYTSEKASVESFQNYMNFGGFPEFLKTKKSEVLRDLMIDIIERDIIARYGIRESKIIKELALYLLTNIGKEMSYNKIAKQFNMSVNTAISFISYLEDAYLLFSIPKFNYSLKKRIISPKKIYSIDSGFTKANSLSFSEDKGRNLENMVFILLRTNYPELFYFSGKNECDFLIRQQGVITKAIQVCWHLTEANKDREIQGLREAMNKFKLKKGIIITYDQEDLVEGIKLVPLWKLSMEKHSN